MDFLKSDSKIKFTNIITAKTIQVHNFWSKKCSGYIKFDQSFLTLLSPEKIRI